MKLSAEVKNLLTKGLQNGFAAGAAKDGDRSIFQGKTSHFEDPQMGIYDDMWFAKDSGAGQELIQLPDGTKWTRFYGGGEIVEERNRLGLTSEQIMSELGRQIKENGPRIRLDESFGPTENGQWRYQYQLEGNDHIVQGRETIYYSNSLVFIHVFAICEFK